MMADPVESPFASSLFGARGVDFLIRIGLLALLGYWTLRVIGPFLTVALWSTILTVALYPLFDWLALRLGSRRLAAILITLLCLMTVIGPVTWLGLGLLGAAEFVSNGLDSKSLSVPLPPAISEGMAIAWRTGASTMDACCRRY